MLDLQPYLWLYFVLLTYCWRIAGLDLQPKQGIFVVTLRPIGCLYVWYNFYFLFLFIPSFYSVFILHMQARIIPAAFNLSEMTFKMVKCTLMPTFQVYMLVYMSKCVFWSAPAYLSNLQQVGRYDGQFAYKQHSTPPNLAFSSKLPVVSYASISLLEIAKQRQPLA